MRQEFSTKTKRAALERSGGYCEGWIDGGDWFSRERCRISLQKFVEFDHILACSNGGDNSLGNCAALCKVCHSEKTRKHDIPRAAKTKRQSDKHLGIKRQGQPIPGSRNSPFKKKLSGEVIFRTALMIANKEREDK